MFLMCPFKYRLKVMVPGRAIFMSWCSTPSLLWIYIFVQKYLCLSLFLVPDWMNQSRHNYGLRICIWDSVDKLSIKGTDNAYVATWHLYFYISGTYSFIIKFSNIVCQLCLVYQCHLFYWQEFLWIYQYIYRTPEKNSNNNIVAHMYES